MARFKTVLFACHRNVGLSQMAAAFFNDLANAGEAVAIAAGEEPGREILPEIVRAMREAGLDLSLTRPQLLTEDLLKQADRIVTLGPPLKKFSRRNLPGDRWTADDPQDLSSEDLRVLRDRIQSQVWKLVAEEGWFAKEAGEFGTPAVAPSFHPDAPASSPDEGVNNAEATVDPLPAERPVPEIRTPSPTGDEALPIAARISEPASSAPASEVLPAVDGDAADDPPSET